ncbi:Glutamate receptor ionotropic, delta-1, partial [Armadillidium vulgare]
YRDILHTGSEDDATYFASLWMCHVRSVEQHQFIPTGIGFWNEMISQLKLKKTDANADALVISLERYLIMDYTLPVKRFSTKFFIKKPVARASWNLYFMPFTTYTWAVIFVFLIFTGIILWVQNKAGSKYKTNEENLPLHSALWDIFIRFLQQ